MNRTRCDLRWGPAEERGACKSPARAPFLARHGTGPALARHWPGSGTGPALAHDCRATTKKLAGWAAMCGRGYSARRAWSRVCKHVSHAACALQVPVPGQFQSRVRVSLRGACRTSHATRSHVVLPRDTPQQLQRRRRCADSDRDDAFERTKLCAAQRSRSQRSAVGCNDAKPVATTRSRLQRAAAGLLPERAAGLQHGASSCNTAPPAPGADGALRCCAHCAPSLRACARKCVRACLRDAAKVPAQCGWRTGARRLEFLRRLGGGGRGDAVVHRRRPKVGARRRAAAGAV